jgi:hypothetical protein
MTPVNTPPAHDSVQRSSHELVARNARKVGRYDRLADAIVGALLAFLGALALLHYLTPCEAATLCGGAMVTPTRGGLRQMLWRWQRALQARYLRLRLAAVEIDIAQLEALIDSLPPQLEHHKRQMTAWALDLASAELDARRQ